MTDLENHRLEDRWRISYSHLHFADDTYICINTPHELQQMLQELADESENQGLKMNKSEIKVMMENGTSIYTCMSTTLRSRTLKATSIWDRDTAPETKTKTRRFKEESRPDGQHLPSTATSSRVTLEHAWRDNSTTHAYFQLDIRGENMGTHHPNKEQASSRTNKDGKEYVKHHIPGQKNKHLGKRTEQGHRHDGTSRKT